jgi:hypothetical protein
VLPIVRRIQARVLDREAMQFHRLMSIAAASQMQPRSWPAASPVSHSTCQSGTVIGRLHVKQTCPLALISRPVSHIASPASGLRSALAKVIHR